MKAQEAIRLRLLEYLKEKSLSINKLATASDMNPSTIISLLNGHSKESEIATISKICYGLEISIREFFNSPLFDNVCDIDFL